MADSTLAKVIQLVAAPETPELRVAAVRVAGRVGSAKDKGLVEALLAALDDADVDLRVAAIESLGQIKADEALAHLEAFARQGGVELEAAVAAASQLGARGLKALGKFMDEASPGVRSRIAAVLARSGTGGGLVVTAHTLLDADPKVVEAAARSLAMEVPSFTPAQKQALAKFLLEELRGKKKPPAKTEAAMLRVLGAFNESKAEEVFWSRLDTKAAPEVRAAALHGLGSQAVANNDVKLQRLLACAADTDFQIVAHALMILKNVPASVKNARHWLKMLAAPDVATRRFAVEKLRGVETAEVARGLIDQLAHPDRPLRDDARQALLTFGKGRQALLERLLEAETPDEAWELARTLAPAAAEFSTAQRKTVFDTACKVHDKDERRSHPLFFLLREMNRDWTRDQLEEKALSLRKRKKYEEAGGYYRLLAQEPSCSEDIRFELAATGLKISNHEAAVEERQRDPALGHFTRLLSTPAFDLAGKVAKARWLEPADLFYLGFHFVEQTHRAKAFGKAVLELVAERSPKSELGKSARKKLMSEGAD